MSGPKLKIYILDDEQHAVDAFVAMCKKKFIDKVTIAGQNTNAILAIEEIESLDIDLLFLDVEMPRMNGLDVLNHFPNRKFQVIFTTAHEQYAISAIKAEAQDYLLKPLSPMEVNDAIDKSILKYISKPIAQHQKLTLVTSGQINVVNTTDIIRIEANNNYSVFYIKNKPKIIISKTLKEYDGLLSNQQFFRVHQTHLVNLDEVIGIQSTDGDNVLLSDGSKVELSRRKKPEFLDALKKIKTS